MLQVLLPLQFSLLVLLLSSPLDCCVWNLLFSLLRSVHYKLAHDTAACCCSCFLPFLDFFNHRRFPFMSCWGISCHCLLNGNGNWQCCHLRTTMGLPLFLHLCLFFSSSCDYHCLCHLVNCSLLAFLPLLAERQQLSVFPPLLHLASMSIAPMLQQTVLVLPCCYRSSLHRLCPAFDCYLFLVFSLLLLSMCCCHHLSRQQTITVSVLRRPWLSGVSVVFKRFFVARPFCDRSRSPKFCICFTRTENCGHLLQPTT